MKTINDLNKELIKLINDFNNDVVTIEIAIVRLEDLILDFQTISKVEIKILKLLKEEFKGSLIYINNMRVVERRYLENLEKINFYEKKYKLITT